jgi:hypothetical protein
MKRPKIDINQMNDNLNETIVQNALVDPGCHFQHLLSNMALYYSLRIEVTKIKNLEET